MLVIGNVIGNYTIKEILEPGLFGQSYIAEQQIYDQITGNPIITKFIIKEFDLTQTGVAIKKELQNLINISGKINSDRYINRYYSMIENGQWLYIISEFLYGKSLRDILLEQQVLNSNETLQLMWEIAEAVNFIHSNKTVHQNIKPSNIFFDEKKERFKLIDFTDTCSSKTNTECNRNAGTTYYMPPELLKLLPENIPISFKERESHDIWSTGVVYYQVANPKQDFMNFKSNDPEIIAKDIQLLPVKESNNEYPPINQIIKVILNKKPQDRPTSGELLILITMARPKCKVNGKEYSRDEAIAILANDNINITDHTTDIEICKLLTEQLSVCTIRNKDFDRQELLNLADHFNISLESSGVLTTSQLCQVINQQINDPNYSVLVVNYILEAVDNYSKVNDSQTLNELSIRLKEMLDLAKGLDLIDFTKLDEALTEKISGYNVYVNNGNSILAQQTKEQIQSLATILERYNPLKSINGIGYKTYMKF